MNEDRIVKDQIGEIGNIFNAPADTDRKDGIAVQSAAAGRTPVLDSLAPLRDYMEGSQAAIKSEIAQTESKLMGEITGVKTDITKVYSAIEAVAGRLNDYIEFTTRAARKQYAASDLIRVRQELQKKFGNNDSIRRYAVSILQADDAQIVRKETFLNCTEELMLAAPKYWLAPCLVAIGAQLNGDAALSAKSVEEAVRRDEEKTCMFFALVTRRMGLLPQSLQWMRRYLLLQNPSALGRKLIVILNAFSEGLFGPDTQKLCVDTFYSWREQLLQDAALLTDQKQKWIRFYLTKKPDIPAEDFKYIRDYVENSRALLESLSFARLHIAVYELFKGIFAAQGDKFESVKDEIDALLTTLVTNFDSEELALKREEKYNLLLIESDGNETAAKKLFEVESDALETSYTFLDLLTFACQTPETVSATVNARKMAFAYSNTVIAQSYREMTDEIRQNKPRTADIRIDEWQGRTVSGENPDELRASVDAHVRNMRRKEEKALRLPLWYALGILILGGLITELCCKVLFPATGVRIVFLVLTCVIIFAYLVFFLRQLWRKRKIVKRYNVYRDKMREILKLTLKEIMVLRAEVSKCEPVADSISDTVSRINAGQFIKTIQRK